MKVLSSLVTMTFVASCALPIGDFAITPTDAPTSFAVPNIIAGTCGANGLQGLMNQPESALTSVSLPANTRIIRPGTTFTKDADRSRLNIGIAADGTIVRVACG